MLPGHVVRGRKNPLYTKFATRLRRARRAAKLSGSALSLAAGLDRTSVSALEAQRWLPRVNTVERLANALGLSPAWLAFGIDVPWDPLAENRLHCDGLAARLSEARTARSLTRHQLGRLTGSSGNAVRAVEDGSMSPLDTVEKFATALGVTASWLAFGIGPMDTAFGMRHALKNPTERQPGSQS